MPAPHNPHPSSMSTYCPCIAASMDKPKSHQITSLSKNLHSQAPEASFSPITHLKRKWMKRIWAWILPLSLGCKERTPKVKMTTHFLSSTPGLGGQPQDSGSRPLLNMAKTFHERKLHYKVTGNHW